jgi:hypothetical protein
MLISDVWDLVRLCADYSPLTLNLSFPGEIPIKRHAIIFLNVDTFYEISGVC